MTITVAQLRDARFGELQEAANAWSRLAASLEKTGGRYDTGVIDQVKAAGWTGSASEAAARPLVWSRLRITAAGVDAAGTGRTLQTGCALLLRAQGQLQSAIDDAAALAIRVGDDGGLTLPEMTQADRRDPEAVQHWARLDVEARKIQHRLQAALDAANTADRQMADALKQFTAEILSSRNIEQEIQKDLPENTGDPFRKPPDGLSDAHRRLIEMSKTAGDEGPSWNPLDFLAWQAEKPGSEVGPTEETFKRQFISYYAPTIDAAAYEAGVPPSVLAGIVYREVGGKPLLADDIPYELRKRGISDADPDVTSFGPVATQVRRGAEALGYDPENLSDAQRQSVIDSLKDPRQNIMIAALHLRDLKESSSSSGVAPQDMTPSQMHELAALFNGGPHWQSQGAQGYADDFMRDLPRSTSALQGRNP